MKSALATPGTLLMASKAAMRWIWFMRNLSCEVKRTAVDTVCLAGRELRSVVIGHDLPQGYSWKQRYAASNEKKQGPPIRKFDAPGGAFYQALACNLLRIPLAK